MTIIEGLISNDVRGIAPELPSWAERLGENQFRGKCGCGWTGPGIEFLSAAYTDWEIHQVADHMPEWTDCPEWCQEPVGHPWSIEAGATAWLRFHSRAFGWVYVDQTEYLDDGASSYADAQIGIGSEDDWQDYSPEAVEQYAADMIEAAQFLRELQAVSRSG